MSHAPILVRPLLLALLCSGALSVAMWGAEAGKPATSTVTTDPQPGDVVEPPRSTDAPRRLELNMKDGRVMIGMYDPIKNMLAMEGAVKGSIPVRPEAVLIWKIPPAVEVAAKPKAANVEAAVEEDADVLKWDDPEWETIKIKPGIVSDDDEVFKTLASWKLISPDPTNVSKLLGVLNEENAGVLYDGDVSTGVESNRKEAVIFGMEFDVPVVVRTLILHTYASYFERDTWQDSSIQWNDGPVNILPSGGLQTIDNKALIIFNFKREVELKKVQITARGKSFKGLGEIYISKPRAKK